MGLSSDSRVSEVEDKDGNLAAPASDERLEVVEQATINEDDVGAGEHTTDGTDAERLPVWQPGAGVPIMVQAKPGNGGTVYLGSDSIQPIALDPGEFLPRGLQVKDLSSVFIRTPTAGDGINFLVEY